MSEEAWELGEIPDVEARVGDLEKWQGIVDYRLGDGERRFRSIEEKMVAYGTKQSELEMHILAGNKDTSALKSSWETWLAEYKQEQKERALRVEDDHTSRKRNRPQWIHVTLVGVSTVAAVIALFISVVKG